MSERDFFSSMSEEFARAEKTERWSQDENDRDERLPVFGFYQDNSVSPRDERHATLSIFRGAFKSWRMEGMQRACAVRTGMERTGDTRTGAQIKQKR